MTDHRASRLLAKLEVPLLLAVPTVMTAALLAYGFASGLLYGVVINAYDIIGFVQPLTWAGAVARLATAVPFDITHGLATCVFLAALYKPWCRRINRVVVKYGL